MCLLKYSISVPGIVLLCRSVTCVQHLHANPVMFCVQVCGMISNGHLFLAMFCSEVQVFFLQACDLCSMGAVSGVIWGNIMIVGIEDVWAVLRV